MKLFRVGLIVLGLCAASLPAGAPSTKSLPVQKSAPVKPVMGKPAVKPAEKAPGRGVLQKSRVVDAAEFVYRKVDSLVAVNPTVIHFSSAETAANPKGAFAVAQSHAKVRESIVPAIKNLLEFIDACVTKLSAPGVREISRTLKIELKDPKESVLADFCFKVSGSKKDEKITAYVTLKGLASAEPVYIRNLLAAALLDDSFSQMHGNKVLGGVAGVAGFSLLAALANNQGWWAFNSSDEGDEGDDGYDGYDGYDHGGWSADAWINFSGKPGTSFVQLLRERVFEDQSDVVDAHGRVTFERIATKMVTSKEDAAWAGPDDCDDRSGLIAMIAIPGVLADLVGSLRCAYGSLRCAYGSLRLSQKRVLIIPWSIFRQEPLSPDRVEYLNDACWTVVVVNDMGAQETISRQVFGEIYRRLKSFAFVNVGAGDASKPQPQIAFSKDLLVRTKTVVRTGGVHEQMLDCSVQALKYLLFPSAQGAAYGVVGVMSSKTPVDGRRAASSGQLPVQDSGFMYLEIASAECTIEYKVEDWNAKALGVASNNLVILKRNDFHQQLGGLTQNSVCIVSPDCFEHVRNVVLRTRGDCISGLGTFIFVNVDQMNFRPCFEVIKVLRNSIVFVREGFFGPFSCHSTDLCQSDLRSKLPLAFTSTQDDMVTFARKWLKNPAQFA